MVRTLLIIGEDLMRISLSGESIFLDDFIEFDKPINFIYGKNGTGKTTITRLIQEQDLSDDIRVYQGVDSVLTDGKLNSVTLGEVNTSAEKKIKSFEATLNEEKENNKNLLDNIQKNELKLTELLKNIEKIDNKINNIFRDAAREIKEDPRHIGPINYNINSIKNENRYAIDIDIKDRTTLENNLKIEPKKASIVELKKIEFVKLKDEVNSLLLDKVKAVKQPDRLNSPEKKNFAHSGLNIHKPGDICSFCGNIISNEQYREIESFFTESDITEFEDKLKSVIKTISEKIEELKSLELDTNCFYEKYQDKITNLNLSFLKIQAEQIHFLNNMKDKLMLKFQNMFQVSESFEPIIPQGFVEIEEYYNSICEQNNAEDFARIKKYSIDLLRFNLIYSKIKFSNIEELENEKQELSILVENNKEETISLIDEQEKLIESINNINENINKEIQKTKSETKLADFINSRLALYVSFQLEHYKTDDLLENNGYYLIKNIKDGTYRGVDTLSKGEKNIIGFLYFIAKLKEINEEGVSKIILFDDPMDSNDEMMQYLIISEIGELIRQVDKGKNSSRLIIMTHSPHFYINIKYNRVYKDGKDNYGRSITADRFIHLVKTGDNIKIKKIQEPSEDFSTSYDLLWEELWFLYENNKPNLMLNSIRRIIETYTKFNRIDLGAFFVEKVENREAKKLFDVNSHSIDDLQAELNGKNAEQIIQLMSKCFTDYSPDAGKHFKKNWRNARKHYSKNT
jgi:DNA repair exonuclease SbcCD ATPase subunit